MNNIEQEADALLKKKNVVAVGLGSKHIDGVNTGQSALLVFVSKKMPKSALKVSDVIPDRINGMDTDVVGKSGTFHALGFKEKCRPIPGGYSCGHTRITAGTLGAWFLDKDGDIVGLSNNHVLAWENLAKDITHAKTRGHAIVQPGPYDDQFFIKNDNSIGRVKKFQLLRKIHDNVEDSAIFYPFSHDVVDPRIHQIGQIKGWNDTPRTGDEVQKTGRTTGYTKGKIIATNAVVQVQYSRRLGVLKFKDQIMTTGMSAGGDSGSCVLDMSNKVVGLLFAGSPTVTIVNKIKYPRETYGLKIYNPELSPGPSPSPGVFSYSLEINGTIQTGHDLNKYNELLAEALQAIKNGSSVSLKIDQK